MLSVNKLLRQECRTSRADQTDRAVALVEQAIPKAAGVLVLALRGSRALSCLLFSGAVCSLSGNALTKERFGCYVYVSVIPNESPEFNIDPAEYGSIL